ncbi:E2 domain-associated cysteine-rich protein [Aureimonas ureilytica]|uniref:E2 domain-associated cysteine-rich protein n=1 Tax=Aureimonas ureilytica TaxID=401562 RepID=UPI0007346B44|nr:E2 domain-associated cysteine-rich protein [Aureimonas ureilytica]
MSLVDFVVEVVKRNGDTVISQSGSRVVAAVQPILASGATGREYGVEVACQEGRLSAREFGTSFLPNWCPERHINPNGTFCLYWEEAEPLAFATLEDVAFWWGKVLAFLARQGPAERLRRWPGKGDARAHGAEAARAQAEAEEAAATLGPEFTFDLREGRLATSMSRLGGLQRVRLLRDGRRIASVDIRRRTVLTLRSRCRCGEAAVTRLPLCACGQHAGALAVLTLALHRWSRAEAEFFAHFARSGRKCCGTIDDCPLAGWVPSDEPQARRVA